MKRRKWIKTSIRLLLLLVIIAMLWRWFEHSQVYHPSRGMDASGAELGRPWEDVSFKASDGVELNGWFFPAETNSPRKHFAILFCHGNGGNISHRLEICDALLRTGAAVFVFDYRGYGRSGGRPGEEGTYRDAQAAHQWLRGKGFAGTNIIAWGESLGGGIASELGLRAELGGLVLESSFTAIADIGAELFPWLPVRWLGSIQYDTRGKLPGLKIPVLVMHSRNDGMIGFHHGEGNFAAANEPKLFCELQGSHNDALWEEPAFGDSVEKFLRLIEARTK